MRNTATLLGLLLRIDPGEAKERVAHATELTSRRTLTGERLDPLFPEVAGAVREGAISSRHATIVATTVNGLPAAVRAERGAEIEAQLVEQARRFDPRGLRLIARRIDYLYHQDGTLADDEDRARRRSLTYRRHADGTMTGTFCLDPVTAEAFDTVLAAGLTALSAEQRGSRTPTQLRHDVFRDHLLLLLHFGELAATGGVTTTMIVTLTLEQYAALGTGPSAEQAGVGTAARQSRAPASPTGPDRLVPTGSGALLTLDELRPLLGDSQVLPVALDPLREITAYGDTHRLFTANQRLAMTARDAGCSFPGCPTGPAWCEAHHILDWADGGPTTVSNGTLLCPYHHRTFDKAGWRCDMIEGVPHWIAPVWLDPTQTPVRNTAHDPGR